MKHISLLCLLSTLNIFCGQVQVNIDNVSKKSITIYYKDINGLQERKIKNNTYIAMPIQTSPEQPDLYLYLKIGKKPIKNFIVPRSTYREYTINPDLEIKKKKDLRRIRRRIRFKTE